MMWLVQFAIQLTENDLHRPHTVRHDVHGPNEGTTTLIFVPRVKVPRDASTLRNRFRGPNAVDETVEGVSIDCSAQRGNPVFRVVLLFWTTANSSLAGMAQVGVSLLLVDRSLQFVLLHLGSPGDVLSLCFGVELSVGATSRTVMGA